MSKVIEWHPTPTGFKVTVDGRVVRVQPHYPQGSPGVPIKDEDKEALALQAIAELSGGGDDATTTS